MIPLELHLPHAQLTLRGYQSQPHAKFTILALHGWLDNCMSFLPLSKSLPDYNILALDLPGHGDSDSIPHGTPFDFHLYLIWLHELLNKLSVPPLALLGHSMGAAISSLYAGVFPEHLSSLILIEGLGPSSVDESEAPQKMRAFIQAWSRPGLARNGLYPSWEMAVRARQQAGRLTPASAELLASRGARSLEPGYMWKHDPRLKLPSRQQFSETQTLAYLRNISCPTLFIEASETILSHQDILRGRMQAIAGLQAVKLEGGHHLHLDEAEPVAAHIRSFLHGKGS